MLEASVSTQLNLCVVAELYQPLVMWTSLLTQAFLACRCLCSLPCMLPRGDLFTNPTLMPLYQQSPVCVLLADQTASSSSVISVCYTLVHGYYVFSRFQGLMVSKHEELQPAHDLQDL